MRRHLPLFVVIVAIITAVVAGSVRPYGHHAAPVRGVDAPNAAAVRAGQAAATTADQLLRTASTAPDKNAHRAQVWTHAAALERFCDRNVSDDERLAPRVVAAIGVPGAASEQDQIFAVLRDRDQGDAVRNEAVNLLREARAQQLVPTLGAVLDDSKEWPRFRSYAAQHLGDMLVRHEIDDAAARDRLRNLLDDTAVPVRREALLALTRLHDDVALRYVDHALGAGAFHDIADLLIVCCLESDHRDAAPTIRGYLVDENPVVRIAAINCLSQWHDVESRSAFEAAAACDNARLRRAGTLALARLSTPAHAD